MAVPFMRPRATAMRMVLDGWRPGGMEGGRVDPDRVAGGGVLPAVGGGRVDARVEARSPPCETRSGIDARSEPGSASASRRRSSISRGDATRANELLRRHALTTCTIAPDRC